MGRFHRTLQFIIGGFLVSGYLVDSISRAVLENFPLGVVTHKSVIIWQIQLIYIVFFVLGLFLMYKGIVDADK